MPKGVNKSSDLPSTKAGGRGGSSNSSLASSQSGKEEEEEEGETRPPNCKYPKRGGEVDSCVLDAAAMVT